MLYALSTGCLNREIPQELQLKFEQWYQQQVCKLQQQFICAAFAKSQENVNNTSETSGSGEDAPDVPPFNQELNPIRTRLRTSFDTELELPLLNKWFCENPHPNRYQIQQYVHKLNELDSRRDRKPLDVNNVVYWFKNARAAHKRAEQRAAAMNKESEESIQDLNNNGNIRSSADYSECINDDKGQKSRESDDGSDVEVSNELMIDNVDNVKSEQNSCDGSEEDNTSSELRNYPSDLSKKQFSFSSLYKTDIFQSNSLNLSKTLSKLDDGLSTVSLGIYDLSRRKRNRTFIDPVSEVPLLERWFCHNSHPSLEYIVHYTAELNRQPYRHKFPKLEPKNVQFWFKNRRAKSKRLKVSAES